MVYVAAADVDQRITLDKSCLLRLEASLAATIDVAHRGTAKSVLIISNGATADVNLCTYGLALSGMTALHNGQFAAAIDAALHRAGRHGDLGAAFH